MTARRPPYEVSGFYVSALRELRIRGATAFELLSFWDSRKLGMFQAYFDIAFGVSLPGHQWFQDRATGTWNEAKIESFLGQMLDRDGDAWRTAPPYPDLMRLSDREAFRQVAIRHDCIIGVRASNPDSGPLIGATGFRVRPLELLAHARREPPHAGCMALDPDDPEMQAVLARSRPGHTWEAYVGELERFGYSVGSATEGYVVRDSGGNLLHPFYELEGVWSGTTRVSLWKSERGPSIRRALNRGMGAELVPLGPRASWEFSKTTGTGPLLPVLWFHPDGHASASLTVDGVAGVYRYYGFEWPYP